MVSFFINTSTILSILLSITFLLEPAYVITITDDQTATNGSTVTIECTAGGILNVFTYQWMKNGVTTVWETGSKINNIQCYYKCTPSNSWGNTNSSFCIVSVNGNFKIHLLHLRISVVFNLL